MNNITWVKLYQKLKSIAEQNKMVKKFGGEFREQMPNFSTKDERYPLIYVVPIMQRMTSNLNYFDVDIYCVDIIQKDRDNINYIVSDCMLILNMFYKELTSNNDYDYDIITDPYITPFNNYDLDYVAGAVLRVTIEVGTFSECDIPKED